MEIPLILMIYCATIVTVHAFPFGQNQRQPPDELIDPFTGICADGMGEGSSNITSYTIEGIVGDCYRYTIECFTETSNQSFVADCGVGLWWDDSYETCVLPHEAAANRPECVKEHCGANAAGAEEYFIVDKRSCYSFYECEADTSFIVYEMCPSGLYFSASVEDCDAHSDGLPPCTRPEPLSAEACMNSTMPEYCPPGHHWNMYYCQCTHPFLNFAGGYDYEY